MARQIAQTADVAQQAQLGDAMEQNTATLRADAAAGLASLAPFLRDAEATLRRVRDERSRASAEALTAPAVVDATGLVRMNLALAGGGRRVNLVVVQAVANAKAQRAPLETAVRELDFTALRALLLRD